MPLSMAVYVFIGVEVVREMVKGNDEGATTVTTGGGTVRETDDVTETGAIATGIERTGGTGNENEAGIHAEEIGHDQDRHIVYN